MGSSLLYAKNHSFVSMIDEEDKEKGFKSWFVNNYLDNNESLPNYAIPFSLWNSYKELAHEVHYQLHPSTSYTIVEYYRQNISGCLKEQVISKSLHKHHFDNTWSNLNWSLVIYLLVGFYSLIVIWS